MSDPNKPYHNKGAGIAFLIIAFRQEIIVNEGKITSSPFLRFKAWIAVSRAVVPLVVDIAYFFVF